MEVAVLGIDLGKNICSLTGLDGLGRPGQGHFSPANEA
jgi:hypothetical protein